MAARAGAEQQAAARAAAEQASKAARAAQLQRARQQKKALQNIYDTEEALEHTEIEFGSDYDAEPDSSLQRPRASGAVGSTLGSSSTHSQRCVNFERNFQQHTAKGVQYRIMFSAELAAAKQQDLEQFLAAKQQRVHVYVKSGAVHPGCTHHAGVVRWRQVLVQGILGHGLVSIPTLR